MALMLIPGAFGTSGGVVILGGGGSGGGPGSDTTAIHDNVPAEISAIALKAVPVAGDLLVIEDSAAANAKKSITIGTLPAAAPAAHAVSHENGGADEISVAGLSGLLADGQTPLAHAASHENGGGDEISVAGLSGLLADAQTALAHAASHQNGGGDEISVAGLSGLLADAQTALAHAASHQNGGGDEISVAGLSGLLADAQTPVPTAGADTTAIHSNVAGEIAGIANKATPVAGDYLLIEDSAAANVKKHILISSLPGGGGTELDANATSENLSCSRVNQSPTVNAGSPGQVNLGSESAASHGTTGAYAGILSGLNNYVKGTYSVVGGGQDNDIAGTYGTALDYGTIAGGFNNQIKRSGSGTNNANAILGGEGSYITNTNSGALQWCVIGGGRENYVSTSDISGGNGQLYSSILGGRGNFVRNTATSASLMEGNTVVGGYDNQIDCSGTTGTLSMCTIGGGETNSIVKTGTDYLAHATISGGYLNSVSGAASYGAISGGRQNSTVAAYSALGGGYNNDITNVGGDRCTIAGGTSNQITSTSAYNTIGGGTSNIISGSGSSGTIGGGNANDVTATEGTVGGGQDNTVSAINGTIPGGLSCTVAGDYGFATGRRAKADSNGSVCFGDSRDQDVLATTTDELVVGMANGIRLVDTTEEHGNVWRVDENQTTDATVTTMWSATLADNSAISVTIRITAMETDGSDRAFYIRNALVYRDGAGATLQGSVDNQLTIESAGATAGAWAATIDTSSNDVRVRITGEALVTINWRGTIQYQVVS